MSECLVIRAQSQEIIVATEFIGAAASALGMDERAVHHVQLAVDEVCSNIIEHAYGAGETIGKIEIRYYTTPSALMIDILDYGPLFNPLNQSLPDVEAPLDERAIGGLGLYFVLNLMDEVVYDVVDGRNCLHLKKLRP